MVLVEGAILEKMHRDLAVEARHLTTHEVVREGSAGTDACKVLRGTLVDPPSEARAGRHRVSVVPCVRWEDPAA